MKRKNLLSIVMVMMVCSLGACGATSDEAGNADNTNVSAEASASDKEVAEEKSGEVKENPYTLSVNGKEQNFPMTYDEFLALGWDSADPLLTASEMGEGYTLGADCSGTIFSGGTGTEYTTDGVEGMWLLLYNPTEAKAAFGEPTYSINDEEEATTTYMYLADEGNWILYMTFDENGIFKYFDYECEH